MEHTQEGKCSYGSNLSDHCSGCTDPHSEGTHQGCTIEHGHIGCDMSTVEWEIKLEELFSEFIYYPMSSVRREVKNLFRTQIAAAEERGYQCAYDEAGIENKVNYDTGYQRGAEDMKQKAIGGVTEIAMLLREKQHNRSWKEGTNAFQQSALHILNALPITNPIK